MLTNANEDALNQIVDERGAEIGNKEKNDNRCENLGDAWFKKISEIENGKCENIIIKYDEVVKDVVMQKSERKTKKSGEHSGRKKKKDFDN